MCSIIKKYLIVAWRPFGMMFLELACVQLGHRILLTIGQFTLTLSQSDSSLWISASEAVTMEQHTELFGFGSGNYAKDSEGSDLMSDTSSEGRWLLYSFTSGTNLVILEKQGQTPEHLASATFWNKAALCDSVFHVCLVTASKSM